MKQIYRTRDYCCICRSRHIECVVSLTPTPWASPNVSNAEAGTGEVATVLVPLDLYLCRKCGHLQLIHIIDPVSQYVDYHYTSSLSAGLDRHFETLVADMLGRFPGAKPDFVFEIGSNDGTVLKKFQRHGIRVLGVDPARPVAKQAVASGVPTIADFFSSSLAQSIAAEHGRASVVVANNVFANLDDLTDIVRGIELLLAPDGVFVFETGYGADVIGKTLLDTVYHEHISYFMVRSLPALFAPHGLEVIDVVPIASKGGSIRCFVQKVGGPRPTSPSVAQMIAAELSAGFDQAAVFQAFKTRIDDIKARVRDICDASGKVAGYGASVGTVTLLNFLGIAQQVQTIYDDHPLATALNGPTYQIPVRRSEALYEERPDTVVIFAWRYADMIVERHQRFLRDRGTFLVPLPELHVINS